MDEQVVDYYQRVKNHIYSDGEKVYKMVGISKKPTGFEIWYDVIFLDSRGDPDGIKIHQREMIWLVHSVNKLQGAKTQIRQIFTEKSQSIRKKYWTKLEKQIKSELKG